MAVCVIVVSIIMSRILMLGISTISGKYLWKGHQLVGCLDQFEDCLLQALLDLQSAWCTECCCHNLYHLISSPAICATLNWGVLDWTTFLKRLSIWRSASNTMIISSKLGKLMFGVNSATSMQSQFEVRRIWSRECIEQSWRGDTMLKVQIV